jgi:hypothetical protein
VHTRSLAAQMAAVLKNSDGSPVTEKTALRWLDDDGPPPPLDVIQDTFRRADQALAERSDALDRVDQALKHQAPGQ